MKIPESILTDIGEMILKCIWNGKGMRKKTKQFWKKKKSMMWEDSNYPISELIINFGN